MIFVPIPVLVAVLLLILFVRIVTHDRRNLPFLALIFLSSLQSTLLGLRWGYGVHAVSYISPVIAAIVPPLVYAGVSKLACAAEPPLLRRLALHSIPALVIIILTMFGRDIIDLALILIFVGYTAAVLRLMLPGADAFGYAPLEGVVPVYRAIMFAAAALFLSAIIDTLVFLDFSWSQGGHASTVLSVGNFAALIILGIAAAFASRGGVAPVTAEAPETQDDAVEEEETIARVDALMTDRKIYRDANLNLDRLARKAVIPTRQISQAINRATGMNVSQYVNGYRVAEACELLETTQKPVTEIMFDVGFQTKSNFNREFRRITEMTPQDWRLKNAANTPAARPVGSGA